MYMCVRGINFSSTSTIFLLKCKTVPTVWYFWFLILILLDENEEIKLNNQENDLFLYLVFTFL